MINLDELCNFLVKAKKSTYASGDSSKIVIEDDSSKTLVFKDGEWRYHDNYFGGEPYGGREVVFFRNMPVYIMVYYGYVNDKTLDVQFIYNILQEALFLIPEKNPFRGPKTYTSNDIEYCNIYEGNISKFSGEETIRSANGVILYKAKYVGGLVDQV